MKRSRSALAICLIVLLVGGVSAPTLAERGGLGAVPSPQRFASDPTTCRDLDKSLLELDVDLAAVAPAQPGRVLSVNDGTLALLVVVTAASDAGAVLAIDFAASVRVSALIVTSGDRQDVRSFDPPVRNGANLRAENGGAIDRLAVCYRVSIPRPPEPDRGSPAARSPIPTATPTSLSLDLSGAQTASAVSAGLAATATAAAADAAAQAATSEAQLTAAASTATANAAAAATELAAAEATIGALQATIAAPTQTPMPTATATAVPTTPVYETTGDAPFAEWQPAAGWDLSGPVAVADGSGLTDWAVVPLSAPTGPNLTAEIEFRVTGGSVCPRNFGLAVRGSDAGYVATGIEWGCDPMALVWAGTEVVADGALPAGFDPAAWHTLRIAAVGNRITIALDGAEILTATEERFADGRLVALWSNGVALEVRAVRVDEVRA